MAIFSLNHSFIGRSKHPPRAASFYARYISRPEACTQLTGERMPTERQELMAWLDEQEQGDRKNARVIDKVIVALPIELSHEDNAKLLHDFCDRMTEGRASWVAAIHDGPGDADNPHAHIIFRDRDPDTDKRVMLTTEKGSTGRLREGWEQEVNIALERAGLDISVDRRSLEEQGIDREPQIHVGAAAMELARQNYEFESNQKEVTRIISGEPTTVTINYPAIDQGRTRFDENEERIARNRARELPANAEDADWTHRGGMVAQQWSAISWVHKANERAELLYERMSNGQTTDDADPADAMLVREHMTDRAVERVNKEARRETTDSKAEIWESRMSDMGRAMRETMEQQRERDHEQGLEIDR
ncbi:MobA/MobL family protein [Rhodopseudomonas pseudopalustris]|uniref:MobA/MobL family protein n=1 Tax=Rhodopseudomonas pseudopalustris TaxID=1513892 RepID=A0A1H8SQI4_9BRAD|nr:MobA/MobL family protein [Rhodopseudomonas pseudopalustris]SEO80837.1 MobA/MobL family protein [Rhodopseudomonas pseudopalustris]